MNTRKITVTLVTLTLLVMATSSLFNDANELQPNGIVEFSHEGDVANGTAILGGMLTWHDGWEATWDCDGGLSLVYQTDWDDFVASGDNDPHNYTSWGIELTGADSYYTENAPEGEWVVTAGLTCIDDMGDTRSAGGQFGDVHENPPTVNLTNGTTVGAVDFTLIEYAEHTFVCGDGVEIPFSYVNDGDEDCDDGSDEQQYDAAGNEINWFDCQDGSQVWIHQVNDGNDDCPDGEDELGDEMSLEDIMEMLDADGDGYLSLDEIIDFINEMENNDGEENISQEEEDMISSAFADSDIDGDGLLDIDELETFSDLMDDMDDGPTFVCGDGEEIPFDWVNDGGEDCDDGSDEQQYDADGNEINWFDCQDGSQVWIHQVNDGNDDCPDGEDEGDSDSPDADEIMEMVDADGDGYLSLQEILDYVNEESYDETGENISQEEQDMIADGFADSDADGDELLDINELEFFIDLMEDMDDGGDDGPTFVCGDGEEIPFDWVNDGDVDCTYGADEQQYDTDGNEINWFDCLDESQVWIHQVNDGNDDCPDGEDEAGDDISLEEIMEMVDADGDGYVSLQEILDFANEIENDESGENMSQEEQDMIADVFAESDSDGDELLNLDELEFFIDLMEDMDDGDGDDLTFVCGDGEEIPFDWVNDGDVDCTYGADEQQYDTDGNEINWFDCHDGSEVWIHQVNDGNDDCPDGEDEGEANLIDVDEIMEMVDSDGDGYLSLQEFIDYANDMSYAETGEGMSPVEADLISDAFTYADNDGNELLDLDEIGPFIDWLEENEGEYGSDDGPDCDRLMKISFQQNADGTADLTFTSTCTFDPDASSETISYMDSDDDGVLSTAEIAAAQDAMDAEQICYTEDGTEEVPCGDDGDDGLFSYDGVVMVTQPSMGDDSMTLSVELGIVTLSSTEIITVSSNASLYSHLFEYDAGALWDGGNEECSGGLDITATSPWSVGNVTFLPATDWASAMNADGTGWSVQNTDGDLDGHCNSQPSNVEMKFTTPEPEPVVDTAPTCDIYYNVGGVILTANSTWSLQIQGAVSFEVPSDGNFTLALPVGEYSVILACNDAEGDAIVVSGTNGDETWGGTAQDGMIYSEGLFTIADSNVSESVDITLTWSSTEFSGTFNTHFTAVESVTDALDVTDTGALPGFTSMISITAMLGAAMILARRKD